MRPQLPPSDDGRHRLGEAPASRVFPKGHEASRRKTNREQRPAQRRPFGKRLALIRVYTGALDSLRARFYRFSPPKVALALGLRGPGRVRHSSSPARPAPKRSSTKELLPQTLSWAGSSKQLRDGWEASVAVREVSVASRFPPGRPASGPLNPSTPGSRRYLATSLRPPMSPADSLLPQIDLHMVHSRA